MHTKTLKQNNCTTFWHCWETHPLEKRNLKIVTYPETIEKKNTNKNKNKIIVANQKQDGQFWLAQTKFGKNHKQKKTKCGKKHEKIN